MFCFLQLACAITKLSMTCNSNIVCVSVDESLGANRDSQCPPGDIGDGLCHLAVKELLDLMVQNASIGTTLENFAGVVPYEVCTLVRMWEEGILHRKHAQ